MTNEYEDFDTDFDGPEESSAPDALGETASTVDQVAALLMGDEDEEDGGKDNAKTALYDSEGETRPKKNRAFNAIELDRHGNRVFDGQDSPAPEPKGPESRYGFSADTPSSTELVESRQQAESQYNEAMALKEKIERQHATGEISDAEASQALYTIGQFAGAARGAILENELAQRDMMDYQKTAFGHIAKEFDIDPSDTKAVNEALVDAVSFLRSQGIADSDLATIDDPAIAITAIRAHRAIESESALKDEVAGLKAQVRRLKKARGEGRSRGQRASQVGATGDRQTDMINEVVALLEGNSNPKGGRR